MMVTGTLLTWVNWNEWAAGVATINFGLGLVGVRWIYKRTKAKFKHTLPLFRQWNKVAYWLSCCRPHNGPSYDRQDLWDCSVLKSTPRMPSTLSTDSHNSDW